MTLLKNLSNNFYKIKELILIFIFDRLFIKIFISYYYGDKSLENEWAILVNNPYNYNVLSMLKFGDFLVPNLWMPPVYAYFIYLHALILE